MNIIHNTRGLRWIGGKRIHKIYVGNQSIAIVVNHDEQQCAVVQKSFDTIFKLYKLQGKDEEMHIEKGDNTIMRESRFALMEKLITL